MNAIDNLALLQQISNLSDEAQLRAINTAAIERIKALRAVKVAQAALTFKEGDTVTFKGRRNALWTGKIVKINRTTAYVDARSEYQQADAAPTKWKVNLAALKKFGW